MAKIKTTKSKSVPDAVIAQVKPTGKPPKVMYDGIDLTIPKALYRGPLPPLAERILPPEATASKRVWIMPDKDRPAPLPPPIFVDNREATVEVKRRNAEGLVETFATYDNLADFEAKHDRRTYPIQRVHSNHQATLILVGSKPWADRVKGSTAKVPGGKKVSARSKVHLIGDLLLRATGCTTADVLAATGWPSVSMPAQAKLAGLALRKEKVGKVTTYFGTAPVKDERTLAEKITNAFPKKGAK